MPRSLTQWQLDYIKEHRNDFPRTEVAKNARVTINTLYKYIREFGGESKPIISDEHKAEIARLYPIMSVGEISDLLGITKSSVIWQAKKQGLAHNEETQKRIKEKKYSSLKKYWNEETYAKNGRRHHLLYKREELRVMSGKPQQTNIKLRKLTQRALNAKMYLRKTHNYFYSKGEPFVLCFDSETKRSKKEEFYTEKFGFKFVSV